MVSPIAIRGLLTKRLQGDNTAELDSNGRLWTRWIAGCTHRAEAPDSGCEMVFNMPYFSFAPLYRVR